MEAATTIGLCFWALSAVMVGYNAWELCRRRSDQAAEPESLWVHVGYYRFPSTKYSGYDKISPLYHNPDSTSKYRWGYLHGNQAVYPSEAAVRRRGVGHEGAPLPFVEKTV